MQEHRSDCAFPLQFKIRKGLDIPLDGAPEQVLRERKPVSRVALLGFEYAGLKPRMLADIGDSVTLGQPLFVDKRDPVVQYTAPGSGRIAAINRGRRRALQSVVIALDEDAATETAFEAVAGTDPDTADPAIVRATLQQSGAWTALRTRPYDRVPESSSYAEAIFVTAVDTRPLAPDPRVIVAANAAAFAKGLKIVARLTDGPTYVCTGPGWPVAAPAVDRIRHAEFAGPHPAGLAGTHIHHLHPVRAGRPVWHIGYQDVIAIGGLFESGRIWTERVVALAGPGVSNPRLIRTRAGAALDELVVGDLDEARNYRVVSGSVLDGHTAAGPTAFLGRHHNQVCAIPVNDGERQLFGWLGFTRRKYSVAGPLTRTGARAGRSNFSTARHGRSAAMIPVGAFERIMPLDILPAPLLRALLSKDTDAAQALGCLELAEEDLALSSFVCPAKHDYGAALRMNLEQIETEG